MKRSLIWILIAIFCLMGVGCSTNQEVYSEPDQLVETPNFDGSDQEDTSNQDPKDESNDDIMEEPSVKECDHSYSKATCTSASVCTLCREEKGEALGHSYSGETCSRCGAKDPDAKEPASKPDVPTHEHDYSETVTKEATCSETGTKTFTCSCGDTYTESIDKSSDHDWESATCTAPKTCKDCGITKGDAKDHIYLTETVKNATCSEEGEKKKTCSRCGDSYTESIDKNSRHDWKVATCDAPKTCEDCGATEGDPKDHFFAYGTCAYCGVNDPTIDDAKKNCSLEVPDMPMTVYEYSMGGAIISTIEFTNVTPKFEVWDNGNIELKIYFSGKKVQDSRGDDAVKQSYFGYKVYAPDGSVVVSRTACTTPSIKVGQTFTDIEEKAIFASEGYKPGAYRLEITNRN